MSTNIEQVVRDGLCCSCGTCQAACPNDAIAMRETAAGLLEPSVQPDRCTHCGRCMAVCPGVRPVFAEGGAGVDPFAGSVEMAWSGNTTDAHALATSQSGGLVTAILLRALAGGTIDKAAVTRFDPDHPLRPETLITDCTEQIRQAQGSKYCPVAANTTLREVASGTARAAFVGLPCQIQGLNRLREIWPKLRTNVAFTLGLFCDRTLSYGATDVLLRRAGVRREDVAELQYRSKKWRGAPGDVRVVTRAGREVHVPREYRMGCKVFFTPLRCRLCHDKFNALADLSLGDAWGVDVNRQGCSVVLQRSAVGGQLLKDATHDGAIALEPVPVADVLSGQSADRRRSNWQAAYRACRVFGWATPAAAASARRAAAQRSTSGFDRVAAMVGLLWSRLMRGPAAALVARRLPVRCALWAVTIPARFKRLCGLVHSLVGKLGLPRRGVTCGAEQQ
jgi:coenzyme F420 hydrogenase subunit beta